MKQKGEVEFLSAGFIVGIVVTYLFLPPFSVYPEHWVRAEELCKDHGGIYAVTDYDFMPMSVKVKCVDTVRIKGRVK